MPFYENVFIARQDVSTQQVEALAQQFADIVAANGGSVTKTETWGLRSLTYRIKKNRKGHYVLLNVDAPPAALAELERNQRLNEDVLRYLSVRVEELEAGPSALLQSRSRDERGRGERGERGERERRPRERDEERGRTSEGGNP
jgi:small subunit ribosomal protein S6